MHNIQDENTCEGHPNICEWQSQEGDVERQWSQADKKFNKLIDHFVLIAQHEHLNNFKER